MKLRAVCIPLVWRLGRVLCALAPFLLLPCTGSMAEAVSAAEVSTGV
jgi:hypothetical protein